MIDPRTGDEAFNLEASSQDELGRMPVVSDVERDAAPIDAAWSTPPISMRCDSSERELLRHDFTRDV